MPVAAGAQTFLERLQKPQKNNGTITVRQDASIDALVNGKSAAQAVAAQKSAAAQKPAVTAQKPVPASAEKAVSANDGKNTQPAASDSRQSAAAGNAATTPATAEHDAAAAQKKVMRNSYKVMGFRVQAFAGGNSRQDKLKAEQAGEKIKASIPGEPVYVHFYSPRWICRVGNYRTYEEAHQMLLAIRKLGYTQASIVKGKISVQY